MKEIFSKGSLLLIAHIIVSLANIVAVPLILNFGSVETLGAFSIYSTILSFIYGISGLGVGFKARRFLPSAEGNTEKVALFYPQLWFQFFSVMGIGLFVLIFWKPLLSLFGIYDDKLLLSPYIFLFYLLAQLMFSQFTDYYRYTHKTTIYAIASSLNPLLYFAILALIYFITSKASVNILLLCQGLGAFIVGFLLLLLTSFRTGFKVALPKLNTLKGDIALGLPLVLAFMVDILLSSSDRFIIGGVLSVKEVGYYLPAYSLGMLIMLIPRLLGVLIPPIISRDVDKGEKYKAEAIMNQVVRGYLIICLTFVGAVAALAKPILTIYASKEVADIAWLNVPIVAFGAVFYGLVLIFSNILNVEMRTRDLFRATVLAAVVNFGLNIIFLPIFKSILVPAITTLVAYVFAWVTVWIKVKHVWVIRFPTTFFIRVIFLAISTGVSAALVFGLADGFQNRLMPLLLAVATGFIVFVTLIFTLRLVPFSRVREVYRFCIPTK